MSAHPKFTAGASMHILGKLGLMVLGIGLGLTTSARATIIQSYSFESPVEGDGSFGNADSSSASTNIAGWTYVDVGNTSAAIFNPQNATFPGTTGSPGTLPGTASGVQDVFINLNTIPNNGTESGTLTTTASQATIAANEVYTLTVAVGDPLGNGTSYQDVANGAISLLAGATEASAVAIPGATTTFTHANLTDGTFVNETAVYTSGNVGTDLLIGENLYISFSHSDTNTTGGTASYQAHFDNILLDATPVPEPISLGLVFAGSSVLMLRRRPKGSRA